MKTVYDNGINDMPKGWCSSNNWNKKVHRKWVNMLRRCYNKKYHETHPTYKDCYVCERWLLLSNFVEDFKLIDGYDEVRFLNNELVLDKDIKSDNQNKCYCLNKCKLVSISDNTNQMLKHRNNDYLYGKNNPMYGKISEKNQKSIKIIQYDLNMNLIKKWNCMRDVERELNIGTSDISACCQFWEMNCNKEEWFKIHKKNPCKTAGGFIWKYVNDVDLL